jgi:hypothetical protein
MPFANFLACAAVLAQRLAGFAVLNWVDDAAMMALMFC